VLFITLLVFVDQPWKGMVDANVVVSLRWSIVSIGVYNVCAFASVAFGYSPEASEDASVSVCHGVGKHWSRSAGRIGYFKL
jgi:hypothetical protein